MADRKQFVGDLTPNSELQRALEESRQVPVTEEELHEQRISFAFGNAPVDATGITKDSIRMASRKIRLR